MLHLVPDDQFFPASEGRMREHRNPSAPQNRLNGLLRADVFVLEADLVDVFADCFFFARGVAVFHHQVPDVRFPRVIQFQQLLNCLLRKLKTESVFQKIQPRLDFFHPIAVPGVNQPPDRLALRVKSVSEDMVLPFPVPAGKLRPAQHLRIVRAQDLPDPVAAGHGVVIRQREQIDLRLPDLPEQFLRRIRPVGDGRMHMQVDFADFLHRQNTSVSSFGTSSLSSAPQASAIFPFFSGSSPLRRIARRIRRVRPMTFAFASTSFTTLSSRVPR